MKSSLEKYYSLVVLTILVIAFQFIIVTRAFLIEMSSMDRNGAFALVEMFPFVGLGADIMLFVLLPIVSIWSLVLSIRAHGWKKVAIVLMILFLFLRYFPILLIPLYFFDR